MRLSKTLSSAESQEFGPAQCWLKSELVGSKVKVKSNTDMSIRQMWKRKMKRRRAKVFLEVEKLSWRITYFRTRKKTTTPKSKKTAWNSGS